MGCLVNVILYFLAPGIIIGFLAPEERTWLFMAFCAVVISAMWLAVTILRDGAKRTRIRQELSEEVLTSVDDPRLELAANRYCFMHNITLPFNAFGFAVQVVFSSIAVFLAAAATYWLKSL